MKTDSKLKEWVTNNLISQQQADQILLYENGKPKGSWFLTGFFILGVLIIGLGIISLTAANWDKIPELVKLITSFSILIILAFATLKYWDLSKPLRGDLLLLSYIIYCMAAIGLIGQIYHTSSEAYTLLLFWSAITFVAVLATQRFITWLLWLISFLSGIVLACSDSVAGIALFDHNYETIFASLTFLLIATMFISDRFSSNQGLTLSLRVLTVIGFTLTVVSIEFASISNSRYATMFAAIMYCFSIFAMIYSKLLNKIQKVVAAIVLSALLLSLLKVSFQNYNQALIAAIFSLGIFAAVAVLMATLRRRRMFNLFLGILGLRFVIFYFEALGGLATTGAGLILSGVLIIYLGILWKSYGSTLMSKIARWANAT